MPVNTDSEMESENGSRHHDAQSIRESEEADSIVFTIRRNQLCKLMADNIVISGDFSTSDWRKVQSLYLPRIINAIPFPVLNKVEKLEIATVIIGSQQLALYPAAFQFLNNWSKIKGPYWIIQRELVRHAVVYCFEHCLRENKHIEASAIIDDAFSLDLTNDGEHKLLQSQLIILKKRLVALAMELNLERNSPVSAMDTLQAYKSHFPLNDFVNWYLKWAREVLEKLNLAKLQREYISPRNKEEKSMQEEVNYFNQEDDATLCQRYESDDSEHEEVKADHKSSTIQVDSEYQTVERKESNISECHDGTPPLVATLSSPKTNGSTSVDTRSTPEDNNDRSIMGILCKYINP